MRIVSQDGKFDLPYDKCLVWTGSDNTIMAQPIGEPDSNYTFAFYSTREKAEKAMQTLHEAYIVHGNFKKIDFELQLKMIETVEKETGLMYGGIFQFPNKEDL